MQELTKLKDSVGQYSELYGRFSDIETLWQLGMDEKDESVYEEVNETLGLLHKELEHLELTLMLSGEYDGNNAIVTLHAGGGWHRGPGLGSDAAPDVCALGGK